MSSDRKHDRQRELPSEENNHQNRNDHLLHERQIINAISANLRNIGDNFNKRYGAHNKHGGERFAQEIYIEEIVHHCVAGNLHSGNLH